MAINGGGNSALTTANVGTFTGGSTVMGAAGDETEKIFTLAAENVLNLTANLTLTFSVIAQDAENAMSAPRTVTLMVVVNNDAPTLPQPPVLANVTENVVGRVIPLLATGTDPEGGQLTYTWSFTATGGGNSPNKATSANVGSLASGGMVTGASGAETTLNFTLAAENVLNLTANLTLTFSVIAQDAENAMSAPRTVTLTVTANNDAPTLAQPPTLAGVNENAASRARTLTATGTDPEGGQLTYNWSFTATGGGTSPNKATAANVGSLASSGTVTGANGVATPIVFTLAAESVLNLTANLTITFTVRAQDAGGMMSSPRTVTLTVTADDDAPVIASVSAATTTLTSTNNTTTLSAVVADENVSGVTYAWSETPGSPLGELTNANTATATFTLANVLTAPGEVVISLTVTDSGSNASAAATTTLAVESLCGSYTSSSTTRTGVMNGANCTYNAAFVDYDNPLTEDLILGALPSGGAHIFAGALVVGASAPGAMLAAANPPIMAGGDGPTLTIEAGATVAFMEAADALIINRGSRIMAPGTADAPITFTSNEDVAGAVGSTVGDQWSGITINGFGVTDMCTYLTAGSAAGLRTLDPQDPFRVASNSPALTTAACDRENLSSGDSRQSLYGGTNTTDNSGVLAYAVIKHASGIRVSNPSALQLATVGSATRVSNVQAFSSAGNGITLDGGAVSITNLLVYNAQVRGIAILNGYIGALERVLVSQANDSGIDCVFTNTSLVSSASATRFVTKVRISRLTCDISPTRLNRFVSGGGILAQIRTQLLVENALIVASRTTADATATDDNYCLRANLFGSDLLNLTFTASVLSCFDKFHDFDTDRVTGTRSFFVQPGDPTADDFNALRILSAAGTMDSRPIFSLAQSASTITAIGGTTIPNAQYAPEGAGITFLGAISTGAGNNPFAGWTFGVFTP